LAARSYKEFGELFSKSDDDELSAYGRHIASSSPPVSLVGKPLPIEGTTLDGTKFNIEQYRGRVVLVDFWATWCGPCVAKLPDLMKLHERFHDKGFEVVGVDLDKNVDDLGKFLDDQKLPWINLIGEKDGDEMKFPLAEKYDISAIPDTYLVGRDGRVIVHNPSDEELSKRLDELLKPAAKTAESPKKSNPESKPPK
jgi:thiol-disulfide isomerase/thioredoxin